MKIIILGAGQVGSTVATNLVKEDNDITIVDHNADLIHDLQDRMDINTIHGYASHPSILEKAGAEDADMVIAVTNSDETNMVACQIAHTLFHTPTKIARVRSVEYLKYRSIFCQEALPIDVLISPEQIVTDYVQRLIEHPGALQVLDFADGRIRLATVRAYYGGPLVGHELQELYDHLPHIQARVAAIFRKGKAIIPKGTTIIEAEDEVFFVATKHNIRAMISELRRIDRPYKRIILAGGGNIGTRLALALEDKYQVKIIERNTKKAHEVSELLNKSLVLLGDAADEDLLLEENIENTDIFCSLTNDDEANILSAMLAKNLGARKAMSLINRASYVDLVQSGTIDIAISPQQATIGSILAHVRRGDVVMVHSLRLGIAEAIEAIAHGDSTSSQVIGKTIEEIELPAGTTIGAIARDDEVLMAHHDTVIQPEDHVILFLVDKQKIPEVEKLFQVGITFM
ncbi:MAG: Trk system potassium transporter TrkA [Methylococcales bacterium]|jgi:trk system potassium uptake protein|nr:Trk system potassium transporter TrkA [Methylococcales bacterium]MBT7409329.1 Trk system potassium transporter TrkA [Methylococcales bacterium]